MADLIIASSIGSILPRSVSPAAVVERNANELEQTRRNEEQNRNQSQLALRDRDLDRTNANAVETDSRLSTTEQSNEANPLTARSLVNQQASVENVNDNGNVSGSQLNNIQIDEERRPPTPPPPPSPSDFALNRPTSLSQRLDEELDLLQNDDEQINEDFLYEDLANQTAIMAYQEAQDRLDALREQMTRLREAEQILQENIDNTRELRDFQLLEQPERNITSIELNDAPPLSPDEAEETNQIARPAETSERIDGNLEGNRFRPLGEIIDRFA